MVGSINNSFPQQIPVANKFQPGVAEDKNQPQNKAINTQESSQINELGGNETQQVQSAENTLAPLSETSITARSDERGQNLDILV